MKDLFDRLLELGILERVPAYSKAPLAVPLPHGAPGSKAEAVAGAVAAAAEAVLPHSREGKKEA